MKKLLFLITVILYGSFFCTKTKAFSNIICIDPGHGGYDGGAIVESYKESDLNLALALNLKEVLINNGYKVIMTREADIDLSKGNKFIKKEDINNRVKIINNSTAFMYISIHMNKFDIEKYSGAQVFYYDNNKNNKELASFIQNSIEINLKNTNREVKKINNVYLLKEVKIPGCLIECGFMSNKEELSNLLSEGYRIKFSYAILDGIRLYQESR